MIWIGNSLLFSCFLIALLNHPVHLLKRNVPPIRSASSQELGVRYYYDLNRQCKYGRAHSCAIFDYLILT